MSAHTYEFEKLQGAGNDFVFVEDLDDALDITAQEVKDLCDRHKGIGADGVIVVKPPENTANDGFMHYINADGTLAQMCGNGVRCFAKYLVDHKIAGTDGRELRIETRAGLKTVSPTIDADGKLIEATVNMGMPILAPEAIPTTLDSNATTAAGVPYCKEVPLDSPFGIFRFTCVSMGNPHAVAFVDDVDAIDIEKVGAYFESCSAFPEKANIEFASICPEGIRMRVYERGCGETLACGTGACATAVAAYLTERTGRMSDLILKGGTLHIAYQPNGEVLMTGPAAYVFSGTITLEP